MKLAFGAFPALCLTGLTFCYLIQSSIQQDSVDDQRDDLPVETVTIEDNVYVLDDSNYDSFISTHRVALVAFLASWCGHCTALKPEYSAAAKILSSEKISLAKVDGPKYSALAKSHDIQGYPTMFVYLNGTKIEYDGPRTAQGIIDHMRSIADPNYKPPEESVLTLTDSTFNSVVAKEPLMLVAFVAPWCGHCKRLKPEFERAAKRLLQLPVPIKLAKVDATEEKELAKQFEVKGYPSIFIFRNGGNKRQLYKGPRDENGIVEYMKSMQKSPSKVIKSREQLRREIQNDIPTVVGFFNPSQDPSLFDLFIDVAYDQFDATNHFVHLEDEKLITELKQKLNSVILFTPVWFRSKYEPNQYKLLLDDSSTSKQILQFIGNHSAPLVGYRTGATYSIYANKYPLVVVYYDVDFTFDHRKQTLLVLEQVQQAANVFKEQGVHFVIANEKDNEAELKELKLEDSGEDVNAAYFASPKSRYAMEPTDEFNAEVLTEFVQQVLFGQVKPVIKSELVPAKNPIKNLWTIVGSTFEEIVVQRKKDTLLAFVAPWCGHCKEFLPVYQKLAESFKVESDKIQIAKIDGTANDYPEQFAVTGFPTLYYVPAADYLAPIAYSGDRSLDDMTKFVHDNLLKSTLAKDEL